jgi:hypothetical protein
MKQPRKTITDVQKIIDCIDLGEILYDRPTFKLMKKGNGFLLQLVYMEPDTGGLTPPAKGSKPVIQKARKWYVSPYSTDTEIVRTAYKAVMTSLEHRLGEHFRYNNQKVYSPHFSIITLETIAEEGAFDGRE